MHLEYPTAPRGTQVDDCHGEAVADPYRWLEDGSSDETRGFIEAENHLAAAWLEAVHCRKDIARRVAELWDHPRLGVPFERGWRWFQYRNTGLQPQPVLYLMDHPAADGEVLVDPNAFSEQGTVALVDAVPSPNGRLLAYATTDAGSDWMTWRVLDVATKTLLPDLVEWSKFSTAAWRADASGFFYGAPCRPQPGQELEGETRGLRVLYHRLGVKDGEDEVVFSADDQPEWLPHATVTDDGRYLVVAVTRGTRPQARIEIFDIERLGEQSVVLDADFSSELAVAGNDGPRFFLVTGDGADRRRLVATDLSDPEHVEEVVPESVDVLAGAKRCGDALVCCYLKDAQAALRVQGLDGRFTREIELPAWSSLVNDEHGVVSGRAGLDVVHFATTSFTDSGSVWSHDLGSGETTLLHPPSAPFDAEDYVTERGHATSADGTRVPFFCTCRRDVRRDGEVPVLIYGYGGFNVPVGPEWSVQAAVFMERGGAYVLANLRGGGEFGRAWHDGGRLEHKQHVFDDFVAVARELAQSACRVRNGPRSTVRRMAAFLWGGPSPNTPRHSAPPWPRWECSTCCGSTSSRSAGRGRRTSETPTTASSTGGCARTRRSTTSARACGIRRRCFSPVTTTTASFPHTPSSSRPRFNGRRQGMTRSCSGWRLPPATARANRRTNRYARAPTSLRSSRRRSASARRATTPG